ncbi:hypothetical protein ACFLS1_07980 [Verrucomicrobiota bacterium]
MKTTNSKELERKSSAVTLSDMEMFIFPELMYSLVLANIMSPRIWRWLDDPWFAGLDKMKPYRRITRLKQYIMDHYAFNLDLDTWGLTTKERELERFKDFISPEILAQSNALFGYEGDKYYFDIDIRTHFGLDKYEGNIIPYWKTETVEAMDAFKHKPNYPTGAGECVSLATLYAAALFVVAKIPLKNIYLMATPLHSQNFIDIDDGILTNNRRLVTKNMWFNGSELSAQARRALENERVTIVNHETGCVHTVYKNTTINKNAYNHFCGRLGNYLKVRLTDEIFGNFLRCVSSLQKCFQVQWPIHGTNHYIPAERVFAYEHNSPYRLTDNTRDKLLADIDNEEFRPTPIPDRITLNDLEAFVKTNKIDLDNKDDIALLGEQFQSGCLHKDKVIEGLLKFCQVKPQLPDPESKTFVSDQEPLGIDRDMTRTEIIERLADIRDNNTMADMAFYAYRDLSRIEPEPFLLASIQRNPASIEATKNMPESDILNTINEMPNESIYDGPHRLAQPDEVWNYRRGDGLEKALLLANILKNRDIECSIEIKADQAVLNTNKEKHSFPTGKNLKEQIWSV